MENLVVVGYVENTSTSIEARREKGLWRAYMVTRNARLKILDVHGAAMKADTVPELVEALKKEYPHWHYYPEKTPAVEKKT